MSEQPPPSHGDQEPVEAEERRVDTTELMGEARSILITHRDSTYRLYVTKAGKLILTK